MSESFIDIDTSDAVEPQAANAGEHLICCVGFATDNDDNIIRIDKNGNKYFMAQFDFPNAVEYKTFSHFIGLPNEDSMEAKQLAGAKWKLESFKCAMGVEDGGFDLSDCIGKETYALISKTDSAEYGEQNGIKKFILGA